MTIYELYLHVGLSLQELLGPIPVLIDIQCIFTSDKCILTTQSNPSPLSSPSLHPSSFSCIGREGGEDRGAEGWNEMAYGKEERKGEERKRKGNKKRHERKIY